jgi:peptidyl-prolyl cis-trans isomerase D
MAEAAGGFVVGQVVDIVRVNPDADPLALGRIRTEVEQSMLADLQAQYLDALRRSANVTFNPTLMGQVTTR